MFRGTSGVWWEVGDNDPADEIVGQEEARNVSVDDPRCDRSELVFDHQLTSHLI